MLCVSVENFLVFASGILVIGLVHLSSRLLFSNPSFCFVLISCSAPSPIYALGPAPVHAFKAARPARHPTPLKFRGLQNLQHGFRTMPWQGLYAREWPCQYLGLYLKCKETTNTPKNNSIWVIYLICRLITFGF